MSHFLKRSLLLAIFSLSSAPAFAMHKQEKEGDRQHRHTSSRPTTRPAAEASTSRPAAARHTTPSSWKKDPRGRLVEIQEQLKPVLSSDFRHGGFPLIAQCQAVIHELWTHTHAPDLDRRIALMDEAISNLTEALRAFPEGIEAANTNNAVGEKVNLALSTMRKIFPVAPWCIDKFDAGKLTILSSSRREKSTERQASTSAAEKPTPKPKDPSEGEKAPSKLSNSERLAELRESLAQYENANLSSSSRRERIMARVKEAYHLLKSTSRTRAKLDDIYEERSSVLSQDDAVRAALKTAKAEGDSARVEALEREKTRLAQKREQFYRDAIQALIKK